MFHPNAVTINPSTNVSPMAMHSMVPEGHLLVRTVFATFQGEMPFSGYPAIFLRLGGCNRGAKNAMSGCIGCDTSFDPADSISMSFEALFERLEQVRNEANIGMRAAILVITGGEPLLQAPQLIKFFAEQHDKLQVVYRFIQFETNGDIIPTKTVSGENGLFAALTKMDLDVSFVVSPKISVHSGTRHIERIAQVLEDAENDYEIEYYYRFVVSTEAPYNEVPVSLFDHRSKTFLSPMTVYKKAPDDVEISDITTDIDLDATRANMARALQYCFRYGVRLSLQSHAYIGAP